MDVKTSKPLPAFGFLTVVEDPQHGFFGGYLVLSELGRPLEFHCSTPVQPNQAQKILYGATLRSYLLGELIGQTLLAKSQLAVQAVLTDQAEMMSLALLRPEPITCLTIQSPPPIQVEATTSSPPPLQGGVRGGSEPITDPHPILQLGNYQLSGSSTCTWHPAEMEATLAPLVAYVDLLEPFERIREAIQEAQRVSNPTSEDGHESAAA